MSLLDKLLKPPVSSSGALPDERSEKEKEKDYVVQEIAADVAVVPFQNERIRELTITVFNQWYVGSCVPHAFITQLEYEGIIAYIAPAGLVGKISQLRAYRKRVNYPKAGSNGVDMYNKIKEGQSNDFPTPERFKEDQATLMPYIKGTRLFDDFNYFQYIQPNGLWDLGQVVKDVAIGKAVSIFFYATDEEWRKEYVDIIDPNLKIQDAGVRHAVCLIPKGDFTKNGKEWLSVHDSAKFGNRHLRYVSYEFLKKRLYFAAKVYRGAEIPPAPEPPVNIGLPLLPCEQGDNGSSVLALQKYLIVKNLLDPRYATGYYGPLTSKAALWFQLFHYDKFDSNIPEILDLGGKYWGNQSIKVVKEIEGINN